MEKPKTHTKCLRCTKKGLWTINKNDSSYLLCNEHMDEYEQTTEKQLVLNPNSFRYTERQSVSAN
jgi:hypothetical protein